METYTEKLSNLVEFVKLAVNNDWQVQGCVIGIFILCILLVLINIEWKIYGSSLVDLDMDRDRIQQDLSTSNSNLSPRELFNGADLNKVHQFPDEDPLTFVKKRI